MNAVNGCEGLLNGAWWYPLVKSMTADIFGLCSPILYNIYEMFGRFHPSPSQHEFNRMKSIQNLQDTSSLTDFGLGCRCTCEYLFASETWITLVSRSLSTCLCISLFFYFTLGSWSHSHVPFYCIPFLSIYLYFHWWNPCGFGRYWLSE